MIRDTTSAVECSMAEIECCQDMVLYTVGWKH